MGLELASMKLYAKCEWVVRRKSKQEVECKNEIESAQGEA